MELFTTICGFVGSWLLVAGPVYQAAQELQEETFAREQFETLRQNLPPQTHASTWWWLLPPVKILLEKRLNDRYRQDFMAAMPPEIAESILHYMNKASGWVLVSVGGLLLAINETHELISLIHWSAVWFWLLTLLCAGLSVLNTAFRMSVSKRILANKAS